MERIIQLLKQYRYGILVLFIGLGLMLLPAQKEDEIMEAPDVSVREKSVQEQLEDILSQIDGAGAVRVLLTEAAGESVVYQQDLDLSGEVQRKDTVVITDADRAETGLVTQVIPASYQGAIIVCQGGDRASVKLAIVEAVSSVTGLTSDKISVWKMK